MEAQAPAPPLPQPGIPPRNIVVIGSSTGGPTALIDIFTKMPARSTTAILVAQHMPDKFTRTFAERLDKKGAVRVVEAQDGDAVTARRAYVCPGKQSMELVGSINDLRIRLDPQPTDRYLPSGDRLFRSVAQVGGMRALGVILTGMGDDGVAGARAIRAAGGNVIAESEETAVVYGMPGAAVRAGVATDVMPLPAIGDYLATLT
jgi:two-component system chemotaxis response regulator CheB